MMSEHEIKNGHNCERALLHYLPGIGFKHEVVSDVVPARSIICIKRLRKITYKYSIFLQITYLGSTG